MGEIPYLAIGNSEPIPEGWPEELKEFVRLGRLAAGWCDHGKRLNECPEGCVPPVAPVPANEAGAAPTNADKEQP